MRYVIYSGLAILGALILGGLWLRYAATFDSRAIVCFTMGAVVGLFAGDCFYRFERRGYARAKAARVGAAAPSRPARQPPQPFDDRLERFRGDAADQEVDDFVSKMPFWTRRQRYEVTPPKSVHLIRRILIRIHSILRDSARR